MGLTEPCNLIIKCDLTLTISGAVFRVRWIDLLGILISIEKEKDDVQNGDG